MKTLIIHLIVSVMTWTACMAGGAEDAPPPAAPNTPLLAEPTAPLDKRIDASRITEQEAAPLPHRILAPTPVMHRIATDPADVPIDDAHWEAAQTALVRGLTYLRAQQDEGGAWMRDAMAAPTDEPDRPSPVAVAVTAMAIKALVQAPAGDEVDPALGPALRFVSLAQTDAGAYEGGVLTNYVTSTVVSCLAAMDDVRWRGDLEAATAWLQTAQWDQTEGLNPRQDWFGGAGYGQHGRPDLSNTQVMLDALYDAGLSPDEPAFQRALTFLSRTQNLNATNSAEWAGNDGGFVYTSANGGESMASEYAGEGRHGEQRADGVPRSLRSYGSMTYAGFKSLLYAGLAVDDARVRAAFDWICRHFTFEENPGLGQQGLFYYYHAMARALRIAQQPVITDHEGAEHNWREALIDALVVRQQEDGSWRNEADRWMEASPVLASTYALLALEEALKPAPGEAARQPTEEAAPE